MNLAHLKDKFAMMPERPDQTMEAKDEMSEEEMNEIFVRQMKYKAGIIK
jgi:hypothetical protein